MGEFSGECGKSKKILEFDPPAELKIEVENLADCPVALSLKDKDGKSIALADATTAKGKKGTWTKTAKTLEFACQAETAGTPPKEGAPPADSTPCHFKYKIQYGDCETDIAIKLHGTTYDKKDWTNFTQLKEANGTLVDPTQKGPSKNDECGPVEGDYDAATEIGIGYFWKVEVEVTADPDCVIVTVDRTVTLQRDDDSWIGTATATKPDPPTTVPVKTGHRWVITDAPGPMKRGLKTKVKMADLYEEFKDATFDRVYTVTATIKRKDNSIFKVSAKYEIKLATDANGKLK